MKIIIGIASIPSRKESLKKVLDSLVGQADEIYLILNYEDEDAPSFLYDYSNVYFVCARNIKGDAEKFRMIEYVKGYYFSCDDDLIYPLDYIKHTKEWIDFYHCIVTYHGKLYDGKRPIPSYRRSFTTNVRCLNTWIDDCPVHVGGTGVMAFNTDDYRPSMDIFKEKNMADVFIARDAFQKGVKIIALGHNAGFLKYTYPKDKTIWQTTSDDRVQTQILNSFLK
jgi:hypothetical protein